jgi:AAA ATPase domain
MSWAPLGSSEEPETLAEQRQLHQEFLADCEQNDAFVAGCSDYRDLGEFEALFRKHFRDYIVAHLRDDPLSGTFPKKVLSWNKNPFRGLNFFDFEDAPYFCGRTKSVGELLDVLQQQAAAEKPFVLVLGPSGSGKTSLVRAGVLPILTRVGTSEGEGPWRLALARPAGGGVREPFEALAAALLEESALPELSDVLNHDGWRHLAAELREHPERAAFQIRKTLDHVNLKVLNPFLNVGSFRLPLAGQQGEDIELPLQYRLGRVKPATQLALVVDQLEELFVGGLPAEVQQKYIAALGALVRCQRVFVIAVLQSDFYATFRKSCPLNELAVLSGRFELNPPSPQEIADMIRLPAEGVGLRFELEPETGLSLDVALLEAATVNSEPLALLEHALWELCRKQQTRKDGLLRWSDFRESGQLENSLANHAESVLLSLGADAQGTLKPLIRQLVSTGRGEEARLIRRTIPNHNLVATPELSNRQKNAVKALIDRFIIEGLFHAETDPDGEILVSVTQEALLRNWPRVCHLLDEDLVLLRMRDQLEANLKLWLCKGRRSGDLLRSETSLSEAETLLRDFRGSLSDIEVKYLQRSLKTRSRRHRLSSSAVLGVIGGLAILVVVTLSHRDALQTRLSGTEAEVRQAQKNGELAASQRDALQAQLKETEAKAQQAQHDAALAASQRDLLQTQLGDTEAKAQQAQKNGELAASQRDALQAQLSLRPPGLAACEQAVQIGAGQLNNIYHAFAPIPLRKPPAPPMETTESDSTPIVRPKLETNRSGVEAHRAKSQRKEPSRSLAHPKAPLTKSEAFRRFDAEFDDEPTDANRGTVKRFFAP